jgi:hypothetical protein
MSLLPAYQSTFLTISSYRRDAENAEEIKYQAGLCRLKIDVRPDRSPQTCQVSPLSPITYSLPQRRRDAEEMKYQAGVCRLKIDVRPDRSPQTCQVSPLSYNLLLKQVPEGRI